MKKQEVQGKQIGLRLQAALLDRVKSFVADLNTKTPGLDASLVDGIRILVTQALDARDAEKTKRK